VRSGASIIAHIRCFNVARFGHHTSRRIANGTAANAQMATVVLAHLQARLFVPLLAPNAHHDKADEDGYQEDNEEDNDQSDADAQRIGSSRGTGDAVAASGKNSSVVNDSIENAARAIKRLNFTVHSEIGHATFKLCLSKQNKNVIFTI